MFSYLSKGMMQLYKTIYNNDSAKIKENIFFFDWLNNRPSKLQFSMPNYNKYICGTKQNVGRILLPKETTISIHPPYTPFVKHSTSFNNFLK